MFKIELMILGVFFAAMGILAASCRYSWVKNSKKAAILTVSKIGIGTVGAIAIGIGMAVVFILPLMRSRGGLSLEDKQMLVVILALENCGLSLGGFIGVYLTGKVCRETGAFLITFLGSVLGGLGAFAIGVFVFVLQALGSPHTLVWTLTSIVCYPLPAIGATIAFNMTRGDKAGDFVPSNNEPNTKWGKFSVYFFNEKAA